MCSPWLLTVALAADVLGRRWFHTLTPLATRRCWLRRPRPQRRQARRPLRVGTRRRNGVFLGQRSHPVGSARDELPAGSGRVRRSVRWWSWVARDWSWLLCVRRPILPGLIACGAPSGLALQSSKRRSRQSKGGHFPSLGRAAAPLRTLLLRARRRSVWSRLEDSGRATQWGIRSRAVGRWVAPPPPRGSETPRKARASSRAPTKRGIFCAPQSGALGRAPGNTGHFGRATPWGLRSRLRNPGDFSRATP